MQLKAGMRLRSRAGIPEVIVVRAPTDELEVSCAGSPMQPLDDSALVDDSAADGGPEVQMGKRYVDESGDLEVLCTKPGPGPLARDGAELQIKGAKPLPSSD